MSYFQFADPSRAVINGGFTANATGEIKTGLLVLANSSQKLTLAGIGDKPTGIALSARTIVPNVLRTAVTLTAGETCTVVSGNVLVWADADYFYALPAATNAIYTYTGGLMHTSGSTLIGTCLKVSNYRTPANTTTNIAQVLLTLGGYFSE